MNYTLPNFRKKAVVQRLAYVALVILVSTFINYRNVLDCHFIEKYASDQHFVPNVSLGEALPDLTISMESFYFVFFVFLKLNGFSRDRSKFLTQALK